MINFKFWEEQLSLTYVAYPEFLRKNPKNSRGSSLSTLQLEKGEDVCGFLKFYKQTIARATVITALIEKIEILLEPASHPLNLPVSL